MHVDGRDDDRGCDGDDDDDDDDDDIYPHQPLNRVATLFLVFLEGPEDARGYIIFLGEQDEVCCIFQDL